jgi:hypothetical protein
MPLEFYQPRGNRAHRAIIGGESFIELDHSAANRWSFFDKQYPEASPAEVEGSLHPGNTPANDGHRADAGPGRPLE